MERIVINIMHNERTSTIYAIEKNKNIYKGAEIHIGIPDIIIAGEIKTFKNKKDALQFAKEWVKEYGFSEDETNEKIKEALKAFNNNEI